jgi:hypothetical protein
MAFARAFGDHVGEHVRGVLAEDLANRQGTRESAGPVLRPAGARQPTSHQR